MSDKKNNTDEILEEYREINCIEKDNFIKKYKINEEGLKTSKVEDNQLEYGLNEIKGRKPKKWYHYLFDSLRSPFNLILFGIVVILLYTDVYLQEDPSYANIIVILSLVIISTFLEFFEV